MNTLNMKIWTSARNKPTTCPSHARNMLDACQQHVRSVLKIHGDLWKPVEINEHPWMFHELIKSLPNSINISKKWKYMKIHEKIQKYSNIYAVQFISMSIYENIWRSTSSTIKSNIWESTEINDNQYKYPKSYGNHCN